MTTHGPGLAAVPYAAPYALAASFTQEARFLRSQSGLLRDNIELGWRIGGRLDVSALVEAIAEVNRRHESLRTSLEHRGGAIVQVVHPSAGATVEMIDLTHEATTRRRRRLELLSVHDGFQWFDLSQPNPLRIRLIRLGPSNHVLLLTATPAFWDAWSTSVFLRELDRLYAAFSHRQPSPLLDPEVQLGDLIAWQRQRAVIGPGGHERRPRWPITNLPSRESARGEASLRWMSVQLSSAHLGAELQRLASRNGTTLSTALLAGFAFALRRVVTREAAEIAILDANRDVEQSHNIIGCVVNYAFVRVNANQVTFDGLVREAGAAMTVARLDKVPLEQLFPSAERAFAHHRLRHLDGLFDVAFNNLLDPPYAPSHLGDLVLAPFARPLRAKYPADLYWHRTKLAASISITPRGAISAVLDYRDDCLAPSEVEALGSTYRGVLQWGARNPQLQLPASQLGV